MHGETSRGHHVVFGGHLVAPLDYLFLDIYSNVNRFINKILK